MNTMPAIDWTSLVAAAREVREHAYAPYSQYQVGAALLSGSGRIYIGCNVENASYGLALCAERSAIAAMIADGERTIRAIAIVTDVLWPGRPAACVVRCSPSSQMTSPCILHRRRPARWRAPRRCRSCLPIRSVPTC